MAIDSSLIDGEADLNSAVFFSSAPSEPRGDTARSRRMGNIEMRSLRWAFTETLQKRFRDALKRSF